MVFTSGGTEADNLALKGLFWARRGADPRRTRILTTAVEHHAVLDPLHWLAEREGAEVELLPVDRAGRLDVDALRDAVERDPGSVALISVMWANNEVGTLQPDRRRGRDRRRSTASRCTPTPCRRIGSVPVDFAASGVDALTLTGHKVGGPFGVGALVVRRELELAAAGARRRPGARRPQSGTIDTPAIAGFAAAVELAVKQQAEHAARLAALRDDLVRRVHRGGARRPPQRAPPRSGTAARQRPPRLPRLRGRLPADAARRPRHRVLHRLGVLGRRAAALARAARDGLHRRGRARSSLRFSLGHTSTAADVDALVEAIGPAVERARAAGADGPTR